MLLYLICDDCSSALQSDLTAVVCSCCTYGGPVGYTGVVLRISLCKNVSSGLSGCFCICAKADWTRGRGPAYSPHQAIFD